MTKLTGALEWTSITCPVFSFTHGLADALQGGGAAAPGGGAVQGAGREGDCGAGGAGAAVHLECLPQHPRGAPLPCLGGAPLPSPLPFPHHLPETPAVTLPRCAATLPGSRRSPLPVIHLSGMPIAAPWRRGAASRGGKPHLLSFARCSVLENDCSRRDSAHLHLCVPLAQRLGACRTALCPSDGRHSQSRHASQVHTLQEQCRCRCRCQLRSSSHGKTRKSKS